MSEHKRIDYPNYHCNICGTNKICKIEPQNLTEIYYQIHDRNTGQVRLTCDKGHLSICKYIGACSCGWFNSNVQNVYIALPAPSTLSAIKSQCEYPHE